MDQYIDANKKSWGLIAEEHYEAFKKRLSEEDVLLSKTQIEELGDISGKSLSNKRAFPSAASPMPGRRPM